MLAVLLALMRCAKIVAGIGLEIVCLSQQLTPRQLAPATVAALGPPTGSGR
jgi:hypothetical protein